MIRISNKPASVFLEQISTLSAMQLFSYYLTAFATCYLIAAVSLKLGPLRQIAVALLSIKWVFFFMFAVTVIQQRRAYRLLIIAVLLEFGVGLLGYFSSFKNVFLLLLVVLLTGQALKLRRIFVLGFLGVVILILGTIWSAIKPEYRDFISQGEGQHVQVTTTEQLSKLSELVMKLDAQSFSAGSETLVQRVGYVQFFSMVLRMVPESIPHENGLLWREAIEHVLKPRLLFPDKVAIDDSERTSYYTGSLVAGAEQGASISLGYMAESYIDFGPVGMFLPIFLIGLFLGGIYRYFVVRSRVKILGFGMAAAILVFGAYNYEMSNIKLLGGNLTAFLVLAVIERFFGGQLAQMIGFKASSAQGKQQIIKSAVALNK
jgi:hypothetical protein